MRSFEHAAASRDTAEAVVVRLELADGTVGWGETLPRPYVTGETLDTVPRDIERILWPALDDKDPEARALPTADADGRTVTAARCALEIARAAAWDRLHWARRSWRAELLNLRKVRVSGVLGSRDPARTARRLGLMRLYGLRDFKLKLGLGEDVDGENLRVVTRRIGRAVAAGRCSLRVDVNGGWSPDETPERVNAMVEAGVCVVEQPVGAPAAALVDLAPKCRLPLMADESAITFRDAQICVNDLGAKVWLNVRLSKNGGIGPALRIIRAAAMAGVPFVVGCMVGESSILSAAQRALLSVCPTPRFVEGNYGRWLLADDLTGKSLRFGWGGRLRYLGLQGFGVDADCVRLERYGTRIATLHA